MSESPLALRKEVGQWTGSNRTMALVAVAVLLSVAVFSFSPVFLGWMRPNSPPVEAPPKPLTSSPIAPTDTAAEAASAKMQEAADRTQAEEEKKFLRTKAGKIWNKHRDWDRDTCEMIAEQKVQIGMTTAQLRAIRRPDSINTTTNAHHVHEQWVFGSDYVYVDDGIVTSFQMSH